MTLIELIITVAVAGILLSIGFLAINGNGLRVSQAANALSGHVTKTRFEAIRANRDAELRVDLSAEGQYEICVDDNNDGTCANTEVIESIVFGEGDLGRVRMTASNLPSGNRVRFDRRGVPMDALASTTFTILDESGTNQRTIALSSTGRPSIQ